MTTRESDLASSYLNPLPREASELRIDYYRESDLSSGYLIPLPSEASELRIDY